MKLQMNVNFPAQVTGSNGDKVVKSNGTYTIQPDYPSLSVNHTAADWTQVFIRTLRADGTYALIAVSDALAPAVGAGLTNIRLAKTSAYTVANADRGKTIALAGTAFYQLLFNAASGYDSDFAVRVLNEDTGRAKLISLNGSKFKLYPGQIATVLNQNNAWVVERPIRWKLTGSTTFYVDKDTGDDTNNDGLAAGAGGAFQTLQKSYDTYRDELDLNGQFFVHKLARTTHTAPLAAAGEPPGLISAQRCHIVGDDADEDSYLISTTGATAITVGNSDGTLGRIYLSGVRLKASGSGFSGIEIFAGSVVTMNDINFDACTFAHVKFHTGGYLLTEGGYSISGDSLFHFFGSECAEAITHGRTVTINNDVNIGTMYYCGLLCFFSIEDMTFAGPGAVTGLRYNVDGGTILAGTGISPTGPTYLPGSIAGVVGAGGRYLDGSATWKAYTPTVTPAVGAFGVAPTLTAQYRLIDGMIVYRGSVMTTNIGTSAQGLSISLPTAHGNALNVPVSAFKTDGAAPPVITVLTGLTVYFNTTTLTVWANGGAFPLANNETLFFEASYPAG